MKHYTVKINRLYSKLFFRNGRSNDHSCHRFEKNNFFFSLPFNKKLAHKINWISFTTLVSYLFITNKSIRLFLTRIDLMVSRINNNIQRKRREMGNIRIFLLSRNGTWQIFVKEIQLNFVVHQSKCNRVLKKQKDVLNSCLIVQCSQRKQIVSENLTKLRLD